MGTAAVRASARKSSQVHDGSRQVQKDFSTPSSTTSKGPENTQDRDAECVPIDPRLLALNDNDDSVEETAMDALKSVMFCDSPNDDVDVDSLPGNSIASGSGDNSNQDNENSEQIQDAISNEYLQEPSKATESDTSSFFPGSNAFADWFAVVNIFKLSSSLNRTFLKRPKNT
ncbi:hypothetical protein MMC15_008567 [Xylographa vitiligo]|nr:hypothetical protein [Xylographa vitiligo]